MSAPDARRRALLTGALALPLWSVAARRVDAAATVLAQTRSGRVRGARRGEVLVFRGLPYAADTAAFRFRRAPREAPWRSIRDALAFGASAPQSGVEGPGSEDCLVLNVWTPALDDGRRRPILVWLHGGGYSTGSGSSPLSDGSALCTRGDVVVVTLNHRLGPFGYLALDQLAPDRFPHAGNLGQLDIIAALQWVREHATTFGGDPDCVTLFGHSGGGAKIATLMAMPAARGLFHRAWTMSGQQVTAAGPRAAMQRAQRLLDALGLAHDDVDTLCRLPPERLLQAARTPDPSRVERMPLYFGPVLDGDSLPLHPFHPEAAPQSASIPMVIGTTRDETRAFLGADPAHHALTWTTLPAALRQHQYSDLPVHRVIEHYRRIHPHYDAVQVFFAATTAGRSWRGAVLEAEARVRQGAPTWVYQLDYASPRDGGRWGALHGIDVPLVFANTAAADAWSGDGEAARAVADTMSRSLLAFARSGDPAHARLPRWQRYSLLRRETLVFDSVSRLQLDPRGEERRLWQQAPFLQRGTL